MPEMRLVLTDEQRAWLSDNPGSYEMVIDSVDGDGNVVFKLAEPALSKREDEKAWVMFEVTEAEAHDIVTTDFGPFIRTRGFGEAITPTRTGVHGAPGACCCKNCPWDGNHG